MNNTKKRKKDRLFQLYIVVPPGLEPVCANELALLDLDDLEILPGGIRLESTLSTIWQLNLWLRCASRVLVELASWKVRDFPTLFQRAKRLPWGQFIKTDRPIEVRVSCKSSRLMHSGRITEAVLNAIDSALGRSDTTFEGEKQTVTVRIIEDLCSISIDSTGAHLHQRGYRTNPGVAPLRENLAAGLLLASGWDGQSPLIDPLCGSGTFLVEAAMIAANIAPGRNRSFSFINWPGFHHDRFNRLREEATLPVDTEAPMIFGRDRSQAVIDGTRQHADLAGVSSLIDLSCEPLNNITAPAPSGTLITNPPYGERIGTKASALETYQQLGNCLQAELKGWQGYVIAPDQSLAQGANRKAERVVRFPHGGRDAGLYRIDSLAKR